MDDAFGDSVPDVTRDESGGDSASKADADKRDDDLRRDVPPHHG